MNFIKIIKADDEGTNITIKGYTFDQLSESAKNKVREWIAENEIYSTDEYYWNEEFSYILTEKYSDYNIMLHDLNVDWDSYGRCSVKLKQGKIWPAFESILVNCAKQVLKDLPTFHNKPELLEDWSRETGSDMYWDNGYFTFYSGMNDIDGYDGYQLSEKIADLCNNAYEEQIEPVLQNIAHDFQKAVDDFNEYSYSDEFVKETCDANEYLFDENGNLLKRN